MTQIVRWWRRQQAARLIRKTLNIRKLPQRQTYIIGRFAIDNSEFRGIEVPTELRTAVATLADA